MRISDWSSDVCSSDLGAGRVLVITKLSAAGLPEAVAVQAPCGAPLHGYPQLPESLATSGAPLRMASPLPAASAHLGRKVLMVGNLFGRSEEHTSELQSLMRISYAVFCLKKQSTNKAPTTNHTTHTHTNQKYN